MAIINHQIDKKVERFNIIEISGLSKANIRYANSKACAENTPPVTKVVSHPIINQEYSPLFHAKALENEHYNIGQTFLISWRLV